MPEQGLYVPGVKSFGLEGTLKNLGAAAAVSYTTFDPATKTAGATLSNGNLKVAANASLNGTAYSVSGKTAGLYVVQWTIDNKIDADLVFGMGLAGSGGPGTNTSSIGCFADGTCYREAFSTVASLGAFVNTDVGTLAINLNTQKAWFRKNSGSWNANGTHNPDTGVGGISFSSLMTPGSTLYLSTLCVQQNSALTLNPSPSGHGLTLFSGWTA